jgi:thymidylate synthase
MNCFEFKTADEMYKKIIPWVVEGDLVKSADNKMVKGEHYKQEIIEKTQVLTSIEDSSKILSSIPVITQSPAWAIAELLSEILNLQPALTDWVNPGIMDKSYKLGPNRQPIYSYGSRWYEEDGLTRIYEKLKLNNTSKRCFLPIFNGSDLETSRPDIPCTLGHMFQIRDSKLNVNALYRSKDIFAGLKYDPMLSQFLQQTLVGWLNFSRANIECGRLSFFDESLHFYPDKNDDTYKKFKEQVKTYSNLIYLKDEELNLCWEPKKYYADLRTVVDIEHTARKNENKNISEHILSKMSYPLFKDWAVVFLLRHRCMPFEEAQSVISHDFMRQWVSLFYGQSE